MSNKTKRQSKAELDKVERKLDTEPKQVKAPSGREVVS